MITKENKEKVLNLIKADSVLDFIDFIDSVQVEEYYGLDYCLDMSVIYDSFFIFENLYYKMNKINKVNKNKLMELAIENGSNDCFLFLMKNKLYKEEYIENLIFMSISYDRPIMLDKLLLVEDDFLYKKNYNEEVEEIIVNNKHEVFNYLLNSGLLDEKKYSQYLTTAIIRNSKNIFYYLMDEKGIFKELECSLMIDAINNSNLFIFEELYEIKKCELKEYEINKLLNAALFNPNEYIYNNVLNKLEKFNIDYKLLVKNALKKLKTKYLLDIFKNKKTKNYFDSDVLIYTLENNEFELAEYFLESLEESDYKGFEEAFSKAIELKKEKFINLFIKSKNIEKNEDILMKLMDLEDKTFFNEVYEMDLELSFNSMRKACILKNKYVFDILFEKKELITNIEELILISGLKGNSYIFEKLIKEYNKDTSKLYRTIKKVAFLNNSKIVKIALENTKLSEEKITELLFYLLLSAKFYSVKAILDFNVYDINKYKSKEEIFDVFKCIKDYKASKIIKVLLAGYHEKNIDFKELIEDSISNKEIDNAEVFIKDKRYSNLINNEKKADALENLLNTSDSFLLNEEEDLKIKETLKLIMNSEINNFEDLSQKDLVCFYLVKKEIITNLDNFKFFINHEKININIEEHIEYIFEEAVRFNNLEVINYLKNKMLKLNKNKIDFNLLLLSLNNKNINLFKVLLKEFDLKGEEENKKLVLTKLANFNVEPLNMLIKKMEGFDFSFSDNKLIRTFYSVGKKEMYLLLFKNSKVKNKLMKNSYLYGEISKECIKNNINNF